MLRSNEVDELIRSIAPATPGAALLAVGGYGRQDLFPYSDIDLLLLGEDAATVAFAPMLRQLWDLGLRVSQSAHTVAQCLTMQERNIAFTLSLMDRRYLLGEPGLWEELNDGYARLFSRKRREIATATAKLTRERHEKYQNTIYHLEPNVKDGPGGLRDLHILRWFGCAAQLDEADAVLAGLRRGLHEYFGRDANVLKFEAQDAMGPSPDQVMAGYFRAARKVQRAASQWMDEQERQARPLFARLRKRALAPLLLTSDGEPSWGQLKQILERPGAAQALRQTHETGLLGRLFPSWARVEGLAIRDYYHQYTVDEHSLVAIENLTRLRNQPPGPFPTLARETGHFPLLLIALLLHDTGKGQGTESHTEASVRSAAPELIAIGMPDSDCELVLFLIGAHLEMSRIMTTRDLTDPQTARTMAAITGTQERLALLTLMTYADISAVNQRSLTPWRTTLLWQLYAATAELPTQPPAVPFEQPGVRLERGNGVWTLTLQVPDRPFLFASVAGAISSFGMDILRAEASSPSDHLASERFTFTDPFRTLELNREEAAALTVTVERAAAGQEDVPKLLARRMRPATHQASIHIHFDGEASQSATVLTITTEDRPGLLYRLAASISLEECNIETVLINTEGRKAIDVFYVTASGLKLTAEKEAQLGARIRSAN